MTDDGLLFDDELAAWESFNTVSPLPDERRTMRERLTEVAGRYGDRPALRCGERTLTYRELRSAAAGCAVALERLGVRADTPVGLVADREVGSYVVVYAAALLGVPYLPIDLRRPAAENVALLRRAGAAVLVGARDSLTELSVPDGPDCVAVDQVAERVTTGPAAFAEPGDDALLYVIHTSGTTGLPKGVCIPRRAMLNLAGWYIARHGVEPGDRLSQNAPLTFDPSAQQIFAAWLSGACLEVMPEPVRLDPHLMVRWLREREITHLDMVTAHWTHLCAAPGRRGCHTPRPALGDRGGRDDVRTAGPPMARRPGPVIAAEQHLRPDRGDRQRDRAGGGPGGAGAVGRRDPDRRPAAGLPDLPRRRPRRALPAALPGEIVIAGAGVADGYLNDEARTAERFTVLRLQGQEPVRVYRTGDVAELVEIDPGRWVLSFRGRRDQQIKLSGYRVELDAVERAAQSCPGVEKAAVLVQGDPAERLALVYAGPAGIPRVRAALAEALPSYVVVGTVLGVPAVPVTPAGKTDQTALAALVDAAESGSAESARPSGAVQEAVAETWAAELGRDGVPVDAPFFALGGSSLAAFRIIAELRRRGLDVRAADLLANGTVAGCAALAVARRSAALTPASADVPRTVAGDWSLWSGRESEQGQATGATAAKPLTRAWASAGHGPSPTAAILLDFDSRYDPAVLARAVRESADRHPALRTRRSSRSAGRLEHLPTAAPVPVVEAADESTVEELRRAIASAVAYGDGEARAVVATTPAGTRHVLLHVAHALVDGVALDRLTGEMVDRARGVEVTGCPGTDLSSWYASVGGRTPSADHWETFRRADENLARLTRRTQKPAAFTRSPSRPTARRPRGRWPWPSAGASWREPCR